MNIDLDGANGRTRPTQRRGIRQILRHFDALKQRRNHRPDGPGVDRAIGVSPDSLINGTSIQTSAAANAEQRFAHLGISEDLRAAVIEDDEMKLFGAILLSSQTGGTNQRNIAGLFLSGGTSRQ